MPLITKRYIAGSGGVPAAGPLPFSTTKTGTVTSVGTVVTGTGTLFTKELVQGDCLYNEATNELREITGIQNDATLIIESAFTSPLSADPVLISRTQFSVVAIIATGAGTKDSVAISTGQFLSFSSEAGIAPFTYSGSLTFDVGYIG